jgi:transcription elongation factor SPT6
MAADALELDEEDVKAEIDEEGPGAVVRRLIKDEDQEKVNDLILEEYAEQLEHNFNQRKRATLETIRAELQQPYEELRRPFALLHPDRIFTMLTGETRDTLRPGMIVPVSVRRVLNHQRQLEVVLDCGIVGNIYEPELSDYRDGINLNQVFSARQIIQAKIMQLSRSGFEATLSLRAEALQQRYRKQFDRMPEEWDSAQEESDRQRLQENTRQSGRVMRVIRHPLFRSFNAAQAEEYLGSQSRGDAVIRPSSLGPDHITVTWKVADNIYQHIDVLELDKETEFSVGRTLKIGQKYSYSDLDELIVNHVKAMARKVDEMTTHEKFQNGTQAETGMFSLPLPLPLLFPTLPFSYACETTDGAIR